MKSKAKNTHSNRPQNVSLKAKSPDESKVIMTELVLPQHTNQLGTIFGGVVMSWMDIAAAIAARRHAQSTVVTASVDALHFVAPVYLGDVMTIVAQVNAVHRTSMEVGVHIESERLSTQERVHNATAYLSFVALDASGKPQAVPALKLVTPEEKRRNKEAMARRDLRIANAAMLGRS